MKRDEPPTLKGLPIVAEQDHQGCYLTDQTDEAEPLRSCVTHEVYLWNFELFPLIKT